MSITVSDYETVPLKDLKPYKRNPRKGDVGMIAKSLKTNGQYRPIVVQKSTNEILAGNHTYMAAKQLGWKAIAVAFVDVSDADARRIMLADNRTNDAASYDYKLLAEVIADVPDIEGTGYTEEDKRILMDSIAQSVEDQMDLTDLVHQTPNFGIIQPRTQEEDAVDMSAGLPGAGGLLNPAPEQDDVIQELDDVSSELEGVLDLKDSMIFPVENDFGIPTLLKKRLVKQLPDQLVTWAGKDVTPDDGVSTYIYNYGVDSASGLPWDRAILSFYTHDFHFENWWRIPAHYVAKVLNANLTMAIAPNFSMFDDDPPVITFWSIYRSFWLARYMQEAGIEIIPDIKIPNAWTSPAFSEREMTRIGTMGIPKNPPVVALQVQNVRPHQADVIKYQSGRFAMALEMVEPQSVLVYGANTGHKMIEDLKLGIPLIKQFNRAHMRRGVVYDSKKGYNITHDDGDNEEEEGASKSRRRMSQNPHSYGTTLPGTTFTKGGR